MKINVQGAVRVNNCHVEAKGDRVVALSIDLHSKYAKVATVGESDGVPIILLGADENTLGLDISMGQVFTELQFPEYTGWEIHADRCSRYTLRVCLVRRKKCG